MIFVTYIRNGIVLGARHFAPDDVRNYWEIHIYLALFQLNIIIAENDRNK